MARLVLSRGLGESIDLVDGLGAVIASATIDRVRDGRVRIAVEAPLSIGVHRREVLEKIRSEQQVKAEPGEKVA